MEKEIVELRNQVKTVRLYYLVTQALLILVICTSTFWYFHAYNKFQEGIEENKKNLSRLESDYAQFNQTIELQLRVNSDLERILSDYGLVQSE